MENMVQHVMESAQAIQKAFGMTPQIGLVLGSGLGELADELEQAVALDYAQIPHFPVSTAPSHKGRLVGGTLCGKQVVCMQGRLHYYEGHDPRQMIFPVRVMKALGVQTLVLTNAAGGVNLSFSVGDIMLIRDHINFMGFNPLRGQNDDAIGPRFNDMTYAYTPHLARKALSAAQESGVPLREGVYLACSGPSYETPAEIRMFRAFGADAVGMSTVPEVIAAAHCGLEVLAFSLITNMAAGVLDQPLSGEEVVTAGRASGEKLRRLMRAVMRSL